VWGTADGVFADGYYYDGTQAERAVPAYPPANHNGAVVCMQLDGVWAGSATDFWSVGGESHLYSLMDASKHIYRLNGECIETVTSDQPVLGRTSVLRDFTHADGGKQVACLVILRAV